MKMSSFEAEHRVLRKSEKLTSGDKLGSKHQHLQMNCVKPTDSNVAHGRKINSSVSNKNTHQNQKNNSCNAGTSIKPFGNHMKMNNGPSNYNCKLEQQTQENYFGNKTSKTTQIKHQHKNVASDEERNSQSIVSQYQNEQDSFEKTNQREREEDCDNILTNLEEKRRLRRERMKIKKNMMKQEKALQREEEMRKKRLAPKDQKITIIDHSLLNKFLEKETSSPIQESKGVYNDSEFPALGEVTSSARMPSNNYQKENEYKRRNQNERKNVSSNLQEPSKDSQAPKVVATPINCVEQNVNSKISSGSVNIISRSKSLEKSTNVESIKSSEESKIMKSCEDKGTGKRPKRRDPIHLSINEIIKVQETKHEVPIKQHTTKPMPKTNLVRYAGNILDSDNPERKRGKQREIPKAKKPSTLKQIILQERARRREIRLQETLIHIKEINNLEVNLTNENRIGNSDDKVIPNEQETVNIQTQNTSQEEKENKLIVCSDTNEKMYPECVDTKNEVPLNVQIKDKLLKVQSNDIKNNKNQETKQKQHEHKISEMNLWDVDTIKERPNSVDKHSCQLNDVNQSKKIPTLKIHSRKFREYCDHFISPDILHFTSALLEDVVKFHDRQFARSPVKASAKRRHVTGLKEVRKFMNLRRVRLLVIAPDVETIPSSGGLDDIVAQLKETAIANEVPYIFALGRRQLGYVLKKKVPVSCVGILNYDGTEHNFHQLMTAVDKAREEYKLQVMNMLSCVSSSAEADEAEEITKVKKDVNKEVVASLLAKLSISQKVESPSPFFQAIERVKCLKQEDDEGFQEINSDKS